jgi:hypothetical protein
VNLEQLLPPQVTQFLVRSYLQHRGHHHISRTACKSHNEKKERKKKVTKKKPKPTQKKKLTKPIPCNGVLMTILSAPAFLKEFSELITTTMNKIETKNNKKNKTKQNE